MSNTSVRTPVLAILALLLSVSAGLALPAPPYTVMAQPFTPEDQGDQEGLVLLTWDAVKGADGYRIWRQMRVDQAIDGAGNLVELDTPEDALVVWAVIDVQPESIVRVVAAAGDGDMTRWTITVELDTPEDALVVWAVIELQPDSITRVVRVVVAAGDGDMTRWAITTLQQTAAGQLESEPRFHSASAGPALPAPPETVVAVPYDHLEHQGDQGGFILLTWDAVDGADGYRLWREMRVDRVLDEAGNLVELDTPRDALVVWGVVDVEPGASVIRTLVATGDEDTRWAVTTVRNTDDGQLESEPRYFQVPLEGVGTGVQARSWGDVKGGR